MLAFVRSASQEAGFPCHQIKQIEIACEEVLVNIIHYAHTEGLELDCESSPGRVLITIADQGIPFNPLAFREEVDTGASLDERKVGGLGVYLAKQLMDQISYSRENESNILTLIKND